MPRLIARLCEDHQSMVRLLDVLADGVCSVRDGGAPDFDLIEEVLTYMTDYPDLFHHPVEDVIFEALRTREPKLSDIIGDLPAEHRQLCQLTRRFSTAIQNILLDEELPRNWVAEVGGDYLTFARRHMMMEEVTLFPLARRMLSQADWTAIEGTLEEHGRPLHDGHAQGRYRRLREKLLAWIQPAAAARP